MKPKAPLLLAAAIAAAFILSAILSTPAGDPAGDRGVPPDDSAFRHAPHEIIALAAESARHAGDARPESEDGRPHAAEVERIRAHLARVERELRTRDVSHLSAEQRAARETHIERLREYRERGVFPRNRDFPDRMVPYFVDADGRRCAVAYLIAESGEEELVQRIASTRNHARVRELADIPELREWLESAGLSLEEAARIQPSYPCCRVEPPPEPDPEDVVTPGYAAATVLASGLGGGFIALNTSDLMSRSPSVWRGVGGVAAGGFGVGLGISELDERGTPQVLAILNVTVGVVSTALGIGNLFAEDGSEPIAAAPDGAAIPGRRAEADSSPRRRGPATGPEFSFSPTFSYADGPAPGLRIRLSL